jgi:hypothetical protein
MNEYNVLCFYLDEYDRWKNTIIKIKGNENIKQRAIDFIENKYKFSNCHVVSITKCLD